MEVRDGRIAGVTVHRGAPCGATWEAARRVVGVRAADAGERIGLETQFFCSANPAGWDPITGKSPVHLAAEFHRTAMARALDRARADAPPPSGSPQI